MLRVNPTRSQVGMSLGAGVLDLQWGYTAKTKAGKMTVGPDGDTRGTVNTWWLGLKEGHRCVPFNHCISYRHSHPCSGPGLYKPYQLFDTDSIMNPALQIKKLSHREVM